MKKYFAFTLIGLMLSIASTSLGKGSWRSFTTPDGRSLEARILQYRSGNGKIQIEREDGKKIWILPTVFTADDQAYIQRWIQADQFMSPIYFKIDGQSEKDSTIKYKGSIKTEERTELVYEIKLRNKTGSALKNLRVEYRAFIVNKGYEGRKDSNHVDGGSFTVRTIPAGETLARKADPIIYFTRYRIQTDVNSYTGSATSYEIKTNQENVKGFWVKVYGPKIDGVPVIREWCYPADTMDDFQWQRTSSN